MNEKQAPVVILGKQSYTINKHRNTDNSVTYSFYNRNGDTKMTVYTLSPGIRLTHHAVHTDHSFLGTSKKGNVIEIHHCCEGRIERNIDGNFFYLTPGDLALNIVNRNTKEFSFPLNHYHGITISINTDIAPKCFSCFLKDVNVQPEKIAKRLCGDKDCFVIRSKNYIEHLFSEMYDVPCDNKKGYYKIKVLELLLILSSLNPDENKLTSNTLSASQVELAKNAAKYIADNIDSRITVSELADRFYVSVTHLQNAFKGVFSVPVASYARICKMNSAAHLLSVTNKSVMEIAGEYGYDNASKFSSAFKEIVGETPLEYRKNHKFIQDK